MQILWMLFLIVGWQIGAQPTDADLLEAEERAWRANNAWVDRHQGKVGYWEQQDSYNKGAFLQLVHEAYQLKHTRLLNAGASLHQLRTCTAQFRQLLKEVKAISSANARPQLHYLLSIMGVFSPGGMDLSPEQIHNIMTDVDQRKEFHQEVAQNRDKKRSAILEPASKGP